MKTLKTLALLCVGALLFVGCESNSGGDESGLFLRADKYDIFDDGKDCATFKVIYNGKELTEGYTIYDENDNPVGNKFSSTTRGTFKFWAEYGAEMTKGYTAISVIATPPAAPAVPTDNNPTKLDFNRRVLLLQFTGTGCQYCPNMVNALYALSKNDNFKNNIAIAAAHIGSFAGSDPALMIEGKTIDDAFGITGYPNLVVDMVKNTGPVYANETFIGTMVNTAMKRVDVKGGIAVNAEYHANKDYVVINALVKAKESADFRIGALLLEDNIYGAQSIAAGIVPGEGVDFNYHNNCIRRVRCEQSEADFTGYDLGNIKAGATASKDFSFPLLKTWDPENLRVLVFISTKEGNSWYVNNVITCPINGQTDFEYTK
jgi:thiol-disulfide isomerase/thioredoxin